ncbi:unnamed protein product [Meloidogyne enterolobii]|uniref:Uncharacterized protein n=1 Tax=Meloidogyne enterolobii TaxID=390850 RepID=A0ACB0XLC9_MELEN
MPQCHRNCHFTPSSHRPIFKSNRWSRPFSINHQSTTFSSVSPAYLLGVIDNSQQENCLDQLDNIKQQKDFEKEEEQTDNQLNKGKEKRLFVPKFFKLKFITSS